MNDAQRGQVAMLESQMADGRATHAEYLLAHADVFAEEQRLRAEISALVNQLGAVYVDAGGGP